eukprot:Phypoly_transcript_12928.p1 GENE.Phypoly_transcript_12928~~Phypoly_transcript_12928.p1  ORF type:complete len:313 (+),score=37.55 Phypoly_transcript_12928:152-1090(+)
MPPSVLVIGASGYIGDGVARAFRRAGYLTYGVIRDEKQREHLVRNEIIPVIGELGNPEALKEVITKCAIIVDAVYSKGASQTFFEFVKKTKAHTLQNYKTLYILTSGIMTYYPGFFEDSLLPKDESFEPHPTDQHEMVPKKKFEDVVLSSTEVRPVVVRPGFVYGGHGGVILPMFFDINPSESKLVLTGRPDKRWSWVHVDDLGEGYVKIAKAGPIVDNQVFNLSAQDNPTYEELKISCAKAVGWKGSREDLVVQPVPQDAYRQQNWETNVIIDSRKAYDVLGWKPVHVGVVNETTVYYEAWKSWRDVRKTK